MEVTVTTSPNWDDVAWRLTRFDSKDLQREYGKAIRQAAKPAPQRVRRATPVYLPDRYAAVLSPALKFSTKPIVGGVTIGATARGVSHPRQVDNLEGGGLRAPSYPRGRRARWSWHQQRVKPGFFSKPITELRDEITRAVREAMQGIADKITGG